MKTHPVLLVISLVFGGCLLPGPKLEPGLWTFEMDGYHGSSGELVRDWEIDGSGHALLRFSDVLGQPLEVCEGMLDAAAITSITDAVNDVDLLGRGDGYAEGDDSPRTIYRIRATGGEAAGSSNEVVDEKGGALAELQMTIEALTRAQVECVEVD